MCGKTEPYDRNPARGPLGKDAYETTFTLGGIEEKVALFKVQTAKRGGIIRNIALPLNPDYEPWAEPLLKYYTRQYWENQLVFNFCRHTALMHLHNEKPFPFEGLTYPIEKYKIFRNGELIKDVDRHTRPFRFHALRHLRATELIERYGFNGPDLSSYAGWTLSTISGMTSVLNQYITLAWQSYFPKLLRKRIA